MLFFIHLGTAWMLIPGKNAILAQAVTPLFLTLPFPAHQEQAAIFLRKFSSVPTSFPTPSALIN